MMIISGCGNLTKDPEEVKVNDNKLCKINIAVNELYTKEDGTRPVQFFTIIAWGKLGENCLKFLKKGSKISVMGNPQHRSYVSSDGTTKYIFEIIAKEIEFI